MLDFEHRFLFCLTTSPIKQFPDAADESTAARPHGGGKLKALVWFWIIDEIYGLILELSVCEQERMVQSQVVELDDGHDDGGD
jgi:hypothetical protein